MIYSKPMKLCSRCGIEFTSDTPERICKDCKERGERRIRKPNARLLKDVHNADKLGISYGEYKASETVWAKRSRMLELLEERKTKK